MNNVQRTDIQEERLLSQIRKILEDIDEYFQKREEEISEEDAKAIKERKRMKIITFSAIGIVIFSVLLFAFYGAFTNKIVNTVLPLEKSPYKSSPMINKGESPNKVLVEINTSIGAYYKKNRKYPETLNQIDSKINSNFLSEVEYVKTETGYTLKIKNADNGLPSYTEKGINITVNKQEG